VDNKKAYWTICPNCLGCGKKNCKINKKARLRYQKAISEFEKNQSGDVASISPKLTQHLCDNCNGCGLITSTSYPPADTEKYPHVAIIGAGIAGMALAVACLHRGIPFTLYERDSSFDARAQGYGLTLQQASNAIKGFGLFSLKDASRSTLHIVFTTEGKEIAHWGLRMHAKVTKSPKRINMHIPRQSLRLALFDQLEESCSVRWGHRLSGFKQSEDKRIELTFQVKGEIKTAKADLIVGADGIRSIVRSLIIGEKITPLRYLGYMVILGICPLDALKNITSCLLDSSTVFQTVNGHERIYVMPYSSHSIMWQLSFPMLEEDAKALSSQGPLALKDKACRVAQWHEPIPQMLAATLPEQISGYPIYDRELLKAEFLEKAGAVTLMGDAAHPMSPFKGQGANQALLDALSLARNITMACSTVSTWRDAGIRKSALTQFEQEMLKRSAAKVTDSAEAVKFLHSKDVLREGSDPKGRCLRGHNLK
jgi:salicylate hydroxylase